MCALYTYIHICVHGNVGRDLAFAVRRLAVCSYVCMYGGRFERFRVYDLPDEPHAKGIRSGCAEEISSGGQEADGTPQGPCVPSELGAYCTGHAVVTDGQKGNTAYFSYVEANVSKTKVGAAVLAGHPAPQHGHLAPTPVPASLDPLEHCGVDMERLTVCIKQMFNLEGPTATPPAALLPGGDLWGAVQCAFAALVMYYPERVLEGEMRSVNLKLQQLVAEYRIERPSEGSAPSMSGNLAGMAAAHETLQHWALEIRNHFNRVNLAVYAREGAPAISMIIHSHQALGRNVGDQSATLRHLEHAVHDFRREQHALRNHVSGQMDEMRVKMDALGQSMAQILETLQAGTSQRPVASTPPTLSRSSKSGCQDALSPPSAAGRGAEKRARSPEPTAGHPGPAKRSAPATGATAPADANKVLMTHAAGAGAGAQFSMKDKKAADMWAELVAAASSSWNGANASLDVRAALEELGLPKGGNSADKIKATKMVSRTKTVFALANALALNQERKLFQCTTRDAKPAAKMQALKNIDHAVREFLRQGYAQFLPRWGKEGKRWPPPLNQEQKNADYLKTSTVETYFAEAFNAHDATFIRGKVESFNPNDKEHWMAKWRLDLEKGYRAEGGAAAAHGGS